MYNLFSIFGPIPFRTTRWQMASSGVHMSAKPQGQAHSQSGLSVSNVHGQESQIHVMYLTFFPIIV
jgi:hypothetical protein